MHGDRRSKTKVFCFVFGSVGGAIAGQNAVFVCLDVNQSGTNRNDVIAVDRDL